MSKELEALETLKFLVGNYSNFDFDFSIIEKPLKALEIIKEKVLEPEYFELIASRCLLTQEEYELLKEVLRNKYE